MKLSDFDTITREEMISIARSILPDGGCLDDDWPDYRDRIGAEIDTEIPFVSNDVSDDIIDEIMGEAQR